MSSPEENIAILFDMCRDGHEDGKASIKLFFEASPVTSKTVVSIYIFTVRDNVFFTSNLFWDSNSWPVEVLKGWNLDQR